MPGEGALCERLQLTSMAQEKPVGNRPQLALRLGRELKNEKGRNEDQTEVTDNRQELVKRK